MKELSNRDVRILKKAFLQKLNEAANGDEEKCFDRTQIFRATELGGYSQSVVPFIVQELIGEGLVRECNTRQEVGITQKGKQRLRRSIENNTYLILETLATEAPRDNIERATLRGPQLQDLTGLTASEINDAVAILSESGLVETFRALGTHPFTFAHVSLTPRGRYEYQKGMRVEELKTEEKKSGEIGFYLFAHQWALHLASLI